MTSLEIEFLSFSLPIVWKKRICLNAGSNCECFKNIFDIFRRVHSVLLQVEVIERSKAACFPALSLPGNINSFPELYPTRSPRTKVFCL